ncbi:MAG: hypothetical protein H7A05_00890 [Pseudomonadales bacterium]|nr:hypothetical protein [Pseudomonadales bacterium]MCP5329888.1 hypothetical protein [Pseudomonadales bacterium]MCP5343151.1 hypothetical protein [Pseudomonadales bacterium]
MIKYALYALVLFLTIGITIARETLGQLGLDSSYLLMAVLALAVTAMLAQRNLFLTGFVAVLCVLLNLPPDSLGGLRIDHDLLIAALLGITLLPLVHRVIVR